MAVDEARGQIFSRPVDGFGVRADVVGNITFDGDDFSLIHGDVGLGVFAGVAVYKGAADDGQVGLDFGRAGIDIVG